MKLADKILRSWRFRMGRPYVRGNCLDVGCHDGSFLRGLPTGAHLGLDIRLASFTPVNAGLLETTLAGFAPKRTFETLTCFATFEHLSAEETAGFWKVAKSALKPEGRIVMTIPHPLVDAILWAGKKASVLQGMEDHQHRDVSIKELCEEAQRHGFRLSVKKNFQFGLNRLLVFEHRGIR